jgi:hypothetical protein
MDAIQPCPKEVGGQPKTDSQVVIQAKMVSRDDEHALFPN